MKKQHLILLTVFVFIILFYDQYVAFNLGLFGIFLSVLTFIQTKQENQDRLFLVLFICSIFSSLAFSYYGDSFSFLAVFVSVFLFRFRGVYPRIKPFLYIEILLLNILSCLGRIFLFDEWIEKSQKGGLFKKLITFVLIPGLFLSIFLLVYSSGSSHFKAFFENIKFNFDFFTLLFVSILGFFVAFVFWNLWISRSILKQNKYLKDDFGNLDRLDKPTFSFLDFDSERISGVVTFSVLNALLLLFIITYNYEQFYEVKTSANELSADTHSRVNSVIFSIIMAVIVILFYFKQGFNFDKKSFALKIAAKVWIILNGLLLISAFMKNTEYIVNLGFTYKRLGVYGFLIATFVGLIFTFLKIKNRKTNAYLFNKMFWVSYVAILICSFVNWGGLITKLNLKRNDFSYNYHFYDVNYNERILLDYTVRTHDDENEKKLKQSIDDYKKESLLSKVLFYEFINTDIKTSKSK